MEKMRPQDDAAETKRVAQAGALMAAEHAPQRTLRRCQVARALALGAVAGRGELGQQPAAVLAVGIEMHLAQQIDLHVEVADASGDTAGFVQSFGKLAQLARGLRSGEVSVGLQPAAAGAEEM